MNLPQVRQMQQENMVLKIEITVPTNLIVIDFTISLLNEFNLMNSYKPFIEGFKQFHSCKICNMSALSRKI